MCDDSNTLTSAFNFATGVRTTAITSAIGRTMTSVWRAAALGLDATAHTQFSATGSASAQYHFAAPSACNATTCPLVPAAALAQGHAAQDVHVGADGATSWTRSESAAPWFTNAPQPAEFWTWLNDTVQTHSKVSRQATYPPGSDVPSDLVSTTLVDGSTLAESAAPWTREYHRQPDGSYQLQHTTPMGRVSWAKFNAAHQLVETAGPGLSTTTFAYGAAGLPASVTVTATGPSPQSRTQQFLWSGQQLLAGSMAGTTDSMTQFAYDAAGRVTEITFADSKKGYTPRTASGDVAAVVPPSAEPPAPTGAPWGSGPPTYTFDRGPGGLLAKESLPVMPPWLVWETSYVYDADLDLSQETRTDGKKFTFTRHPVSGQARATPLALL